MHRLRPLPGNGARELQTERRRRAFLRLQTARDSRRRSALQRSHGRLPGRSDRQRWRLAPHVEGATGLWPVRWDKMAANPEVPVALTIAGSDSSAGAGIQADLKTFGALGVYGLTAVTCVVAEIPGKVSRIEPVSAQMVREQVDVLAKSFPIAAIKTGLLCSAEII